MFPKESSFLTVIDHLFLICSLAETSVALETRKAFTIIHYSLYTFILYICQQRYLYFWQWLFFSFFIYIVKGSEKKEASQIKFMRWSLLLLSPVPSLSFQFIEKQQPVAKVFSCEFC